MKIFPLTFVVLLSSSTLFIVDADTPYKDCGSSAGTINQFQVTNCNSAPCVFLKGNSYAMNLTFQAKIPSKKASVSIHGIIGQIPIPFPSPEPDACQCGMKCPTNQGDINTVSLSLPILSSYPSISLYAQIEIKTDDSHDDYACIRFPARITGSNSPLRKLIEW